MRLSSDIRQAVFHLFKKGHKMAFIARLFGINRHTAELWCKRAEHRGRESFRDKPKKAKQGKVTLDVEMSILALRNTLCWGTARIQQGMYKLPSSCSTRYPAACRAYGCQGQPSTTCSRSTASTAITTSRNTGSSSGHRQRTSSGR